MKRYINPEIKLLTVDALDIVRTSNVTGVDVSNNSDDISVWRLGSVINNQ